LLIAGFLASLAWAEQKPADLARPIAPFVNDSTVAVLHLDVAKLDLDALRKQLAPLFPNLPQGAVIPPPEVSKGIDFLRKSGVRQVYLLFSVAGIPQELPLVVLFPEKGTDGKALAENLTESKLFAPLQFEARDNAVIGTEEATRQRLRKQQPSNRPEIAQGFEALGLGTAHLILIWPGESRRILEETMPQLPEPLGGGSIKVLTRGLKWLAVRLDPEPKLSVSLIAQAQSTESASALKELLQQALASARQQGTIRTVVPQIDQLTRLLVPEVSKDRLLLQLEGEKLLALLQQPLDKVRLASQRTLASNNLKQLGLAMHKHLDAHSRFPARASLDKEGKPLLSWRVHVLPYLDQEKLYKEFHLDEPWDSEHNKKLIARMPEVFAAPGSKASAGKTPYLAPVGPETVFASPGSRSGEATGMKIADIVDGTANTILLVDAAEDRVVIWTRPDDLPLDPKQPLRGLGFKYGDGFLALFCDGSIHFVAKTIDPKTLTALFTPQGGEAIP